MRQDKVGSLKIELNRLWKEWPTDLVPAFQVNNRLRTTAGRFKPPFTIEVSGRLLEEFGLERAIGTLRHEFVHFWLYDKKRPYGHTEEFKRLCAKIGGTMNRKLAGNRYDNGTSQYLREPYRYEYRCDCGASIKRKRRLQRRFRAGRICGRCGTSLQHWFEARLVT